jgi:hypothetical protein
MIRQVLGDYLMFGDFETNFGLPPFNGSRPDQGSQPANTRPARASAQRVDAQVNAMMARALIQSAIQLGLGEIGAAGEAQIKLDPQYSSSLTAIFTSIGKISGVAPT